MLNISTKHHLETTLTFSWAKNIIDINANFLEILFTAKNAWNMPDIYICFHLSNFNYQLGPISIQLVGPTSEVL